MTYVGGLIGLLHGYLKSSPGPLVWRGTWWNSASFIFFLPACSRTANILSDLHSFVPLYLSAIDKRATMDSSTLSQLSERLQEQASSYTPGNEQQRQKLLATTNSLLRAIETPSERIARMCYADNFLFIAMFSASLLELKRRRKWRRWRRRRVLMRCCWRGC
jgi:hypothetical protein